MPFWCWLVRCLKLPDEQGCLLRGPRCLCWCALLFLFWCFLVLLVLHEDEQCWSCWCWRHPGLQPQDLFQHADDETGWEHPPWKLYPPDGCTRNHWCRGMFQIQMPIPQMVEVILRRVLVLVDEVVRWQACGCQRPWCHRSIGSDDVEPKSLSPTMQVAMRFWWCFIDISYRCVVSTHDVHVLEAVDVFVLKVLVVEPDVLFVVDVSIVFF